MSDTVDVLRAAGLPVVDARVPGRGSLVVRGGMLHHDAIGPVTRTRGIEVMRKGRSDLSGPLANAWLDRDGTWCVITDQRANHAGACSTVALGEAFAGRVSAATRDARDRALLDDTSVGNRYLFGVEVANNGLGETYPVDQLDSLARGVAALNRAWGLTSGHWLHHRQATRRKIDMSWRGDIWRLIDDHQEDDDMAVTNVIGQDHTRRWWWFKSTASTGVEIDQDTADFWFMVDPKMFTGDPNLIERLKAANALVSLDGKTIRAASRG